MLRSLCPSGPGALSEASPIGLSSAVDGGRAAHAAGAREPEHRDRVAADVDRQLNDVRDLVAAQDAAVEPGDLVRPAASAVAAPRPTVAAVAVAVAGAATVVATVAGATVARRPGAGAVVATR